MVCRDAAPPQRLGQDVGGRDRVLDRQVDADAANGSAPRNDGRNYACFSGVRTTRPSSSALTLIWHDKREFGRTS